MQCFNITDNKTERQKEVQTREEITTIERVNEMKHFIRKMKI